MVDTHDAWDVAYQGEVGIITSSEFRSELGIFRQSNIINAIHSTPSNRYANRLPVVSQITNEWALQA